MNGCLYDKLKTIIYHVWKISILELILAVLGNMHICFQAKSKTALSSISCGTWLASLQFSNNFVQILYKMRASLTYTSGFRYTNKINHTFAVQGSRVGSNMTSFDIIPHVERKVCQPYTTPCDTIDSPLTTEHNSALNHFPFRQPVPE